MSGLRCEPTEDLYDWELSNNNLPSLSIYSPFPPPDLAPIHGTRARKPARTKALMICVLKTCTLPSFETCPTASCLSRVPTGTIGNGHGQLMGTECTIGTGGTLERMLLDS
jgi:hypothetical protein